MKNIKEIISHLKDKGFVFQSSSIYGGLANSWDFGPLGSMLKDNIKNEWKKIFIDQDINIFHLDSNIMLNTKVWEASGHISKFNDPLIDCKECKSRFRSDHLILSELAIDAEDMTLSEQTKLIQSIDCPSCGKRNWTDVRRFDLMFKTSGSKIDEDNVLYLRPETAQGVFINFKNVVDTLNPKIPFGIGQIGKAFRNEITPGNFIFRTKEFEQLELEFFSAPDEVDKWFDIYLDKISYFLSKLNLSEKKIKQYNVPKDKLAHYSKKTIDFEYNFPFGYGEILGLANRGDFDLSNHKLEYNDQVKGGKYVPHVLETSMGVERLLFSIASELIIKEKIDTEERIVFKLPYNLCPYKASIMPLTNALDEDATILFRELLRQDLGPINYLKSGTIGKRYRKQDAIGTMYCITYDFDSKVDHKVTIRHRDTMKQERVAIKDIKAYILNNEGKH